MKELFAVNFLIVIVFSTLMAPALFSNDYHAYGLSTATISRVKAGLVASDALTNTQINTSYWAFGGDAVALHAPYDYYQNAEGLHIGVQAANSGEWAGYYGVSPSHSARLFHAILRVPFSSVPDNWWDTGMYIQTSSPMINYVTCAAVVSTSGITWAVVSTKGNSNQATEFNTLWKDTSANQPAVRDCTIVTNGTNLLKVFMDGQLVFSSSTLNLDMPEPFNAYLEAQTSTSSGKLYGFYSDYYVTSDTTVRFVNAPAGGTVKIVDSSSNKLLGKDTIDAGGKASIGIAKYHLPLSARIEVYDPTNNLIASKTVSKIWAGDIYKVSYNTAPTAKNSSTDDTSLAITANTGQWNTSVKLHVLPPSLFQ